MDDFLGFSRSFGQQYNGGWNPSMSHSIAHPALDNLPWLNIGDLMIRPVIIKTFARIKTSPIPGTSSLGLPSTALESQTALSKPG
jgi:hypothetical protein